MENKEVIIPIEIEFNLNDEKSSSEIDACALANFDPYKNIEYENLCKDFHKLMHKHRITDLNIILSKASFDGTFYKALQEGFSSNTDDDFRQVILDVSIPNPDYKGKVIINDLDNFPTFDENPFV